MANDEKKTRSFVSSVINFDITKLENDFRRADIEIHNVDHSGPSYEGRVFLNNPDADESTELTESNGYVGSYHIFGHGGCVGNLGHCDILPERRSYDKRPRQDLRPQYKRIIITDMLKKTGENTDKFTITIVPVLYENDITSDVRNEKHIVKFDKIGIITYD
jgi:hypothetical protein